MLDDLSLPDAWVRMGGKSKDVCFQGGCLFLGVDGVRIRRVRFVSRVEIKRIGPGNRNKKFLSLYKAYNMLITLV